MHVIRMLRKKAGLSQAQLARQLHVNQTTISKWENQQAVPDIKTIDRLAEIFAVPISILLNRLEDPVNMEYDLRQDIPLVRDLSDLHALKKAACPTYSYEVPIAQKQDYFAYCLQDDAMAPELRADDIVIIRRNPSPPSGRLVLAATKQKGTLLRRLVSEPSGWFLVPLNADYRPCFIRAADEEAQGFEIFGTVVELRRRYDAKSL